MSLDHPFIKSYQEQPKTKSSWWQQLGSSLESKLGIAVSKPLLATGLVAVLGLLFMTASVWRLLSPTSVRSGQVVALDQSSGIDPHPLPSPDSSQEPTQSSHKEPEPSAPPAKEVTRQSTPIVVDVAGAVKKPGVYGLPAGARLGDAISAAGGISPAANSQLVAQVLNLASPIEDSQKIYIPFAGESAVLNWGEVVKSSTWEVAGEQQALSQNQSPGQVSSDTQSASSQQQASNTQAEQDQSATTKISVNTATAKQLMELSGIGEARSAAIIANRPYDSLEEVVSKGALTQKLFDDLKDQLRL